MGFGGNNGGQGGIGGLGNKKVVPTFGVSFGLPYPSGAYGGYPINPFGGNPIPNPHFGAISPNGLNLGLVNVNPLVSFQVSKNEYGEKLLKPLVNLHVTPNENIIHKVGSLFHAKKHGIQQTLSNVNYHHHTHQNYPPPPSIYHPHHYEEPHHYPHHHESPHHYGGGPEFYPSGPSGGGGGGYGFAQPGHGSSGYYRDAAPSSGGDYESPSGGGGGGAELDYNPNEYYSRSANVTNNPNQYNYQSYYPEQNLNQNQEQNNYQDNYANNYNYGANQNQNQNYQNQNQNQNYQNQNQNAIHAIHAIPTPAPGDSRGAKHVSFPNNRRKRDVDQSEIIESEDKKEIETEERSLSIEKVMYKTKRIYQT